MKRKRRSAALLLLWTAVCLCVLAGWAEPTAREPVEVSFGVVEAEEDAVLLAAFYTDGGRMLASAEAVLRDGIAVVEVSGDTYEKMVSAKLFVLDRAAQLPLGQVVTAKKTAGLSYSFYPSTRKVMAEEELEQADTFPIQLARNEAEGCQLVFAPHEGDGSESWTLDYTDFVNEQGHVLRTEVFELRYIPCESDEYSGFYPDALVPVEPGHRFTFEEQTNHPYYIKVWADRDTPAGNYTACLSVRSETGEVVSVPLSACVWDFALPDTPACTTAFGLSRQYVAAAHGAEPWSEEDQPLYNAYYEFLLEHNISAYDLPYDILDERADAYMSDPRVTSFCLPYFETWEREDADEVVQVYYEKVSSNPEWADKAYFYVVDEPYTAEHYGIYLDTVERLKELCPGYHMVMPTGSAEFEEDGVYYNAVLMHAEGADIFCPLTPLMEDEMLREDIEIYLSDSRLWWYVCCGPAEDYCNVLTNMEGIRARLLLWQQKAFNVNGLLYWQTAFWAEGNPWDNGWTYRGSEEPDWSFQEFGDGSLLYPGSEVGIDGPIASLRLELLSDGIEDFEYLTMAEERFGRDYVEEKIATLSTSLTDYTFDDDLLLQVRQQVGEDLARTD